MSRVLQCLPSFQNFLGKRGVEKVKNGRSGGGLPATKKEEHRFIPLPPRERVLAMSQTMNQIRKS